MVFLGELCRRQIAQSRLLTNSVVEDFNVLGDFLPGLCARSKAPVMHQLVFQGSPETLHRRVVPTIALAAHGSLHAELLQLLSISVGAVLAATI